MSLKDIASLGKLLGQFLVLFADCFRRPAGRSLLAVYVRGLLSDVQRKNVEAMALARGVAPRTLQRFLESIQWDEELLRDRCQQLVAREHADPEAIGAIDETGTTKSGAQTAGVKRQYNGNRGVTVHTLGWIFAKNCSSRRCEYWRDIGYVAADHCRATCFPVARTAGADWGPD